MVQLKICGIRNLEFALRANEAGVSYLGFVFAPSSPRCITPSAAAAIAGEVRSRARERGLSAPRFVGVFPLCPKEKILSAAATAHLDVIQLHDSAFPLETIRAVKHALCEVWLLDSGSPTPPPQEADAILVDSSRGSVKGGTGLLSDWTRVAALHALSRRVILAGGLSPANIASAARTNPDILDVNSGIESAPGVKSLALLNSLIANLRAPPSPLPKLKG